MESATACLGVCFILLLAAQPQYIYAQTTTPSSTDGKDHNNDHVPHQSLSLGKTIVFVFFLFIFILAVSIYIYILYFSGSRISFPNRTNFLGRSESMPRPCGLASAVVNTFPTFSYSQLKRQRIGKRSLECAVCLLEYKDDHILRLLPKCSHIFHTDCIDPWLALHVTCPVCRVNLLPKPGELIAHVTCPRCHRESSSNSTESNSLPVGYGMGSGFGSDDLTIDIVDTSTTPAHQTVVDDPVDGSFGHLPWG